MSYQLSKSSASETSTAKVITGGERLILAMRNGKHKMCLAALCFAALSVGPAWAAGTIVLPADPSIQYYGRWDRSSMTNPGTAWPGSGIVGRFKGTSTISATFVEDNGNNRIFMKITNDTTNTSSTRTIRLPRGTSTQVLATGLAPGSSYTVEIVKKTEGCCGAGKFTFKGFTLDAQGSACGALAFNCLSCPLHRLEFYGDSHAAGYSAECTCNSGDTGYKNAFDSYPAVTSRLLGAEFHNQSWSGIGIYNGYATVTMRQAYTETLQSLSTPVWDFIYQPDVVVVQLGDNDVYNGATQAQISQALVDFVTKDLRPKYRDAHIVLAATIGWDFHEVANYIDTVATGTGDANVSWVKLPWFSGQEHRVYCEQVSHANILAAHISDKMGWGWTPETNQESSIGCLPDPATSPGPVPLKNGDFESSLTVPAGNAVADGWRSFSISGGGTAAVVSDSGNRYLRLTPKKSGYVGLYQAIEHLPHVSSGTGLYFRATANMRVVSGSTRTAKLRIEFLDQAQNLISQVDGLQTLSGSWGSYSTTAGPAPAGTWHVRVVCVSDSGSTVDFDAVTLEASTQ